MCYIFKSLKAARLLNPGDTIALGVPIFTPYLEMPHLEDYALKIVNISAEREDTVPVHRRGTSSNSKIRRSRHSSSSIPAIPPVWRSSANTIDLLVNLVKTKRP